MLNRKDKRAICSPELSYFSKRYHQNQLLIWKRTSHLGMSRSCAQWQEQKTPVHPTCLNFPNGTTKTNYGFGKGCFGDPKPVLEYRGFVLNDKTSVHPNCLNFSTNGVTKTNYGFGKGRFGDSTCLAEAVNPNSSMGKSRSWRTRNNTSRCKVYETPVGFSFIY